MSCPLPKNTSASSRRKHSTCRYGLAGRSTRSRPGRPKSGLRGEERGQSARVNHLTRLGRFVFEQQLAGIAVSTEVEHGDAMAVIVEDIDDLAEGGVSQHLQLTMIMLFGPLQGELCAA